MKGIIEKSNLNNTFLLFLRVWPKHYGYSIPENFSIYLIVFAPNVYLDDDSVVKVFGMNSIVVEMLVKAKMQMICIKDALNESKL